VGLITKGKDKKYNEESGEKGRTKHKKGSSETLNSRACEMTF
jgi:hypothetical protein